MADEAKVRPVTEEVTTRDEDNGQPQELEITGGEEGDRSPDTADSVVDSFFASEEGSEKGSVENGKDNNGMSCQDGKDSVVWSSDDEKEVGDGVLGRGSDMTADELQPHPWDGGDGSQAVLDSRREFPEDQQEAVEEGELGPEEMIETDDGQEELSNIQPAQSPTTADQKKVSNDHSAESPDSSADEDGADGEGNQETQESFPARVASPVVATSGSPVDNSQNSDQDEEMECKDGKANDQDVTGDSHLEVGSEMYYEPEFADSVGNFLHSKGDPEGVHMVAQNLIQQVLDRVIMAETNTNGENAGAKQETDTKVVFSELSKVDMNSETWGSQGVSRTSPAVDNGSLSNSDVDIDREKESEKLPWDSEPIPEFDGDLKGGQTGPRLDLQPCQPEDELPGESQQLYQYTGDRNQSAASPPCSQVSVGIPDSRDTVTVPAPAHSSDAASSTELSSLPGHSGPPQSSRSAQDQPSARNRLERSQEAEESHDGSYLWLQRQVQWRAGSAVMPAVKGVRESVKGDCQMTSPSGGYQGSKEEVRGVSSGRQDLLGDGGLGTSVSASTDVSGSMTSPGAIPNFNTLRDQQVSWLSMYRMLEEQHRTQLQAQYTEHQRMINDMQRQLEGELLTQQQSMRQKLDSHREALRETSSYSGSSRTQGSTSWYNKHSAQGDGDLFLRSDLVSPLQQKETYTTDATRSVQGGSGHLSSRDSMKSPERSGEKRLRGGVYSSPMPTAKFRTSAKERSSYEPSHHESCTGSMSLERRSQRQEEDYDCDSRQLSTQTLSPRTHQSLRDKHAKHLSDLRSYYEAEIQDLRQKLSAEGLHLPSSSATVGRESARERILQEENQMLRLQLRDLQDSLDDSQIYSRDLEQKLQGLEIRAGDYGKRYEESQNTVLKLKNRLEELHSYAKDRESVLEQIQTQERRQAADMQELYKAKEEEEERARRDTATIKRLLDKYELLEKDYSALKDTSAEFEQKLFDTRSEAVQLNKVISQLELENKRLTHDNDNMRHRLAISGSLPITRQELAGMGGRHRASGENLNGFTTDSPAVTHAYTARSGDTTPPRRVLSDEEAAAAGTSDSPLLRAERELRRLQQTLDHGEFIPRLQPKKYTAAGSLCPASGEVTIIDAFSSPTRSGNRVSVDAGPKEGARRGKKTVSSQPAKREKPSSAHSKQPTTGRSPQKSSHNADSGSTAGISSPTRFDVGVSQPGVRSAVQVSTVDKKGRNRDDRQEAAKTAVHTVSKGSSGHTQRVDSTLERIRSGQFVSRPQWEDVYTSLAKPAQSDKSTSRNMTQEEMLRDRIRSIDQMEKRYDDLHVEKRQLESQLNKVPAHGRDRKSRREKELLEEKLDSVDHELGSLRMTLKRYQVLKTTM